MHERTYKSHELPGAGVWSPLAIVEAFTGEELTIAVGEEIKRWPAAKRANLADRLASAAIGCLSQEVDSQPDSAKDDRAFSAIDRNWRTLGATYELSRSEILQQLLYLPRIVVADQFARVTLDFDPLVLVQNREYFKVSGKALEVFWLDGWLSSLCELAPAVREGLIQLAIPCSEDAAVTALEEFIPLKDSQALKISQVLAQASRAFARDLENAPDARNAFDLTVGSAFWKVGIPDLPGFFRSIASSLETASDEDVWKAINIRDKPARYAAVAAQAEGREIDWDLRVSMVMRGFHRSTRHLVVPALATNFALGCSTLVGSHSVAPGLTLFGLHAFEDAASQKQREVSTLLSRFQLPGVSRVSLKDVLSIRRSEASFDEFRRTVGDLMYTVATSKPGDQTQFELELEQAVADLLTPKIDALKKSTQSSLLEKSFIPSGLALGTGAIVYSLIGSFPATAAAAAGASPLGYLADRLYKRYRRSGRKDSQLVEGFITLRQMTQTTR